MARATIRLFAAGIAIILLIIAAVLVNTSGPSAGTDCLERIAEIALILIWLDYAISLSRSSNDLMEETTDPCFTQADANDPQQAARNMFITQVRKEANEITMDIFLSVGFFFIAGIILAFLASHYELIRNLSMLLHCGPGTRYFITPSSTYFNIGLSLFIIAAAMMACESNIQHIASSHPFAWREARSYPSENTQNVTIWLAIISVASLIFVIGCMDSYIRFTDEDAGVGRFPLIEQRHEWDSQISIRKLTWYEIVHGKVGSSRVGPFCRYQLLFPTGSDWRSPAFDEYETDQMNTEIMPAVLFACSRCKRNVEDVQLPDK